MIWIFAGNNHLLITTWLICCSFDPIWHWACLNFSDNLTKQVKDASLLESCSHPQTKSGNLPPSSINMSLSFPREESCSFLSKHEMVRYMKAPKKSTWSCFDDITDSWYRLTVRVPPASLGSTLKWKTQQSQNGILCAQNNTRFAWSDIAWWSSPSSQILMIKPIFSKGWVDQDLILPDQDHILITSILLQRLGWAAACTSSDWWLAALSQEVSPMSGEGDRRFWSVAKLRTYDDHRADMVDLDQLDYQYRCLSSS